MRKLNFKTITLLILVAVLVGYFPVKAAINWFLSGHELTNKKETFNGNSTDLKKTVILATLDTPIVLKKNNIWCSSFQLAWNEMKDAVIKDSISVSGAGKLCQRLNNSKQKKTDLLENSYYAAAGTVSSGIINKISSNMTKRFPSMPLPEFNSTEGLIACAYLETYIKFKIPYLQNDEALPFTDSSGNKTAVKSFGVWGDIAWTQKSPRKQIKVLYCKLDTNHNVTTFALDLCKDSEPYQIVISNIEPNESLELTYNELQSKIAEFKNDPDDNYLSKFGEMDFLYIPEMFWKITHHFNELEGKMLSNANLNGLPILNAMQMINFRLDRRGVVLKSESWLTAAALPRAFILNKPFLIYLKKRDAVQPFFVMWVDNAELLTPF